MTKNEYHSNRPKVACPICGKLFTKACFNRHYQACSNPDSKLNQETNKQVYSVSHEGLSCCFCEKTFQSVNALTQHELRCSKNPNRKDYCKAGFNLEGNATIKRGETKETSARLRRQGETLHRLYEEGKRISATKGKPGTFLGKHHTKEQIDKMMETYHSTLTSRKSRYKFGVYKDVYCDSGWELAFLIYCFDRNIDVKRCSESFEYYNPVKHKMCRYYPDFIIEDTYYEIKGQLDKESLSKIEQFPADRTLVVIDSHQIKLFFDYCLHFYGKDFYKLYDRSYPSWMDNEDISS